jgi:hypothetical protein
MKPARATKSIFLYPPGRYVPVQRYENFLQTQKLRNLKFAINKETPLLSRFKAVSLFWCAIYRPAKDMAK